MVEPAGPFKIILSEMVGAAADQIGNPVADQVRAELCRLFDLDEAMATSITGAMPIVILHGLDARQAGGVRDRLRVLVELGVKVITTDEASDTLPHVNWPVLPPIAQFEPSDEKPAAKPADPAPVAHPTHEPGVLTCPSCQASFRLTPVSGLNGAGTASAEQPSRVSRQPEEPDDDWMSPPVTRVPAPTRAAEPEPAPPPPPPPPAVEPEEFLEVGGSARFNEASLLAYSRAEAAPAPFPEPAPPPPPPPDPISVSTFGSGAHEIGSTQSRSGLGGLADEPSSFDATGSLHDSGSDILDLDPPHRHSQSGGFSSRASGDFEDDFDLLGSADEEPEEDRAPTLESLEELEEVSAGRSSGSFGAEPDDLFGDEPDDPFGAEPDDPFGPDEDEDDPFSDAEFGKMLQSEEEPRGRRSTPSHAGSEGDLDAVLRLFGPEDEKPLDDMAGLQPAPLDLNPSPQRRNLMGSEFPSDILEPLNPSEAMEIIKSQKTRGSGRTSDDDFDLFGNSDSQQPSVDRSRKSQKKTRGVPFSASGEDLDLFEDSRPSRSRGKSRGRAPETGGGADPFARARKAMDEERSAPKAKSKQRRESGGRSSSRRSRDRAPAPAPTRGGGGGGPAPTGAGDHGLVLSRISDPEKKERAAELIAEIKGCSLDDASRLTERTIIPVLKGVSRDVAEFHLDKFRRYKIAGRVTTRQRS